MLQAGSCAGRKNQAGGAQKGIGYCVKNDIGIAVTS